jgi:hypothetical protein
MCRLSINPGAFISRTHQGHVGLFRCYFTFLPPYGAEVNEWSHNFAPPLHGVDREEFTFYILVQNEYQRTEDGLPSVAVNGLYKSDIYFRDTRQNVTSFTTTGKVRFSRKTNFSKFTNDERRYAQISYVENYSHSKICEYSTGEFF